MKIRKLLSVIGIPIVFGFLTYLYLFDAPVFIDQDNDDVPRTHDNCEGIENKDQIDSDIDGIGDLCDDDDDNDGCLDECAQIKRFFSQDYFDRAIECTTENFGDNNLWDEYKSLVNVGASRTTRRLKNDVNFSNEDSELLDTLTSHDKDTRNMMCLCDSQKHACSPENDDEQIADSATHTQESDGNENSAPRLLSFVYEPSFMYIMIVIIVCFGWLLLALLYARNIRGTIRSIIMFIVLTLVSFFAFLPHIFERFMHYIPALSMLDQPFFIQSWPNAYRFLVKIPAVLLGVAMLHHHWQPKKQRRARTQYKKAGENKNLNISEVTTNILTENIHGVLRVSAYSLGGVLVLAAVADTSPQEVLAGAGAITAAAGFLLRDYLMGLIANIHLRSAINKRTVESHRKAWAEGTPPAIAHPDARERRNRHPIFIGDWVEFPSYAVDGEVEAIGLRVIHIRGWDKTLHSVPLLAVNNHNWRLWDNAIHDEGRRRFVRSINVSAPSVRAIDETWLQNISEKLEGDISPNTLRAAYSSQIEPSSITTNLDAFMRYIKHYLTSHTLIDKECTLQVMMRPHDPRDGGRITVGLMAFSKITKWTPFEELQNHIVNYCYSVMGHFDLKPFSIDV